MENKETKQSRNQETFLDKMDAKTSFIAGLVMAVLVLGTVGFVVLGSCMLSGGCTGIGQAADSGSGTVANNGQPAPAPSPQPSAAPTQPTNATVPAVTEDDHIRGASDAPLTLVEYSDFECPFCGRFKSTVDQVLDEYDGQVRFVYRHFPLTSIHPQAEGAGEAAECAGEQGAFWEFHDALFENQSQLSESLYLELAGQFNLDTQSFQECLDSDRNLQIVRDQLQDGSAAGVTGTPGSFLLNESGDVVAEIKGAQPYSQVQSLIEANL